MPQSYAHIGYRMINETEPKPKANVTAVLVKRVSERVAKGIPLKLALAGEPVAQADYEEQLRQSAELAAIQDAAKREFLEDALDTLIHGKHARPNIRWLLGVLYPGLFAKSPGEDEARLAKQNSAGIPDELLKRIQEAARRF
jgi:hypothetical protein